MKELHTKHTVDLQSENPKTAPSESRARLSMEVSEESQCGGASAPSGENPNPTLLGQRSWSAMFPHENQVLRGARRALSSVSKAWADGRVQFACRAERALLFVSQIFDPARLKSLSEVSPPLCQTSDPRLKPAAGRQPTGPVGAEGADQVPSPVTPADWQGKHSDDQMDDDFGIDADRLPAQSPISNKRSRSISSAPVARRWSQCVMLHESS